MTQYKSTTKMVPFPSFSIVPERDLGKRPVLEARHLGIEFGGLKAVEDFNLIIGKTEIAGLSGPNGAGTRHTGPEGGLFVCCWSTTCRSATRGMAKMAATVKTEVEKILVMAMVLMFSP